MGSPSLWILTRDFPPHPSGGVRRAGALTEQLRRLGFAVTVISSNGNPDQTYPAIAARLKQLAAAARLGRAFRQAVRLSPLPDESALDWPGILAATRKLERPDLIVATAPPHSLFLAAEVLARRLGCRWVADFRDPWTRYPDFRAASPIHRRWAVALERHVVAHADGFMVATNLMGRDLAERAAGKPVHVFLNGYDPGLFRAVPAHVPGNPPVVGFYGSLYGAIDPDPLVRAVARAGAILEHAGTDYDGALGKSAARHGATLRSLGMLPGADAVQRMQTADVLGLVIPDRPEWNHHRSQKLAEYLASGRPILAIVPPHGEAGELIRGLDAGVVVSWSETVRAAEAIKELALRENRPTAPAELSWESQAIAAAEFLRARASAGSRSEP
ncbi:MAG: glycosyltransferase [Deltaproteobacteria bacterium]|nr:glycosyltransferase [Deltaproteobacteria bacterium]